MAEREVYTFGTFSWTVTVAIVVVVFCLAYFYVRRKRSSKHVDSKAGDERQD